MRILKIYDGDYPWDIRVEKISDSLVQAGHDVTLLARNRAGRVAHERLGGVEIRRLAPVRRFEQLASFPAFFHPRWVWTARKVARECRPERVFVRDLPLAPLGIALGRAWGVPSIIDMAEPYPLALRSNWQFDRLGGFDHVLRSPRLADFIERWVLRHATHQLVVSEEAGERFERLGLDPRKWTLVGNTPKVAEMRALAEKPVELPQAFRDRPILLFSGILVGDRGLDVAIRGLRKLLDETGGPRPALLILGDGPARAGLESLVTALGLERDVHLTGWIAHDDLPRYWAGADLGLLPFHTCDHIETTLANKLFDFMSVGLPVLAADVRPMRRVLQETGAGTTHRPGDPDDFARAARALLSDPARCAKASALGKQAADQTYNWERDSARLLDAIETP